MTGVRGIHHQILAKHLRRVLFSSYQISTAKESLHYVAAGGSLEGVPSHVEAASLS